MTGFILWAELVEGRAGDWAEHPFNLPAVRALARRLHFSASVTIITGDNGSGKSTLLEAFAAASGLNVEGGSQNFNFSTLPEPSALCRAVRIARTSRRPRSSFFLRAESFFNVATEIQRLDEDPQGGPRVIESYGGRSLHQQSHAESFLSLLKHRLGRGGLYFMDEPEGPLSVSNQIAAAQAIHADSNGEGNSQVVIATNSPFIAAIPGATIYRIERDGLFQSSYDDLPFVEDGRAFLSSPAKYFSEG